jgi:Uma2 family endonuclease
VIDPEGGDREVAAIAENGQRFLLHDVGWRGYETMLQLIGDRPIRLTYDRGNLELRTTSRRHEKNKRLLGRLIDVMTEELEIPRTSDGSTTWRRQVLDRGLEPDECFYLYDHAEQLADKEAVDLDVDPPPDLAIEIDITRSSLDRQGIYAALGVPELWRFDGESLRVFRLRADRTYEPCTASPAFPFLPLDDVVRLLKQGATMDQSRWGRMVRAWVRNDLAPRYQGRPDAAGPA